MNGIENILFFVEDEPDLEILDRTFDLAEVYGARLTVATTVRTPPTKTVLSRHGFEPGELERLVIADRRSKLTDAIENVGRPGVDTKTVVLTGAPVPAGMSRPTSCTHGTCTAIPSSPTDEGRSHPRGSRRWWSRSARVVRSGSKP